MKLNSAQRNEGNTLITVVIFTAVLSILMLSYLTMAKNSITLTARSMVWNDALPVAEAGIEEAAAAIQSVASGQSLSATLQTNGWTASGNVLTKTRNLTNAYFTVLITSTNTGAAIGPYNSPVIYSTGYVQVPIRSASIQRTVQVQTKNNLSVFQNSLLVKKSVNSNGNSVLADAFDSSNPSYSSNGQYTASKAMDGGGIATLSGLPNQLNFGSGQVYGPVATGPGGSISSLNIGTHSWLATHSGVQSGYFTTNMTATLQNVVAPYNSGAAPLTVAGITTVWGGTYYINSGNFGGKVVVNANATIYVTSAATVNFSPASDSITIQNGASLTLYVGSGKATLPNMVNGTGRATGLAYYGLPTNTNITMNVNADFVGTLYAPQADVTLGGNGTGSAQNIIGALVANSINYNDSFYFHYDQNLGGAGAISSYSITSWSEL